MAPLADAILTYVPLPTLPEYLTRWVPGQTPLSTPTVVSTTIIGYLALIFGIQAYQKDRQPLKANAAFQVHNTFLYLGSGLLLVLMLEEVIPLYWKGGLFYAMCDSDSWTSRLEFYYLINYYFKYVELIDTVFLALKKKPLAFLHVFHHSATAVLCFSQLNGKTSVSWVVISLNLFVHVLMYYYYYATAGGRKIWWKKYLTSMQITQFIIDLFAVYFGTYSHFASKPSWKKYGLPAKGNCAGTEDAAIFGCVLLTSYLGLFINFYINTYKKSARKPVANSSTNGHAVTNSKAQ